MTSINNKILFLYIILASQFVNIGSAATEEIVTPISEIWGASPDTPSPNASSGAWVKFDPPLNVQTVSCNANYIYVKSSAEMQLSVLLVAYSQGKQVRIRLNDGLPKSNSYCQAEYIMLF